MGGKRQTMTSDGFPDLCDSVLGNPQWEKKLVQIACTNTDDPVRISLTVDGGGCQMGYMTSLRVTRTGWGSPLPFHLRRQPIGAGLAGIRFAVQHLHMAQRPTP